jgi:hypothetical protein
MLRVAFGSWFLILLSKMAGKLNALCITNYFYYDTTRRSLHKFMAK